ncbi:unnamed protein product, partial [Scytosiphon promiscuus]
RTISLKKSCDFCVRRKRYCDGFGRKRCSFCIEKNQIECHYSIRSPITPSRVSMKSTLRRNATQQCPGRPPLAGRSFFAQEKTGEKKCPPKRPAAESAPTVTSLPPLKRSQLSASPATGLVGLQENEFLKDFYECLGFLSLASESTVRSAMVSVMCASAQERRRTASGQSPDEGAVGESPQKADEGGDGRERCWKKAVSARNAALPHNSSTCVLWCAIALGALVQGRPFAHVQGYLELAQDSLAACAGGRTLDTARAYLAMAFLLNFLGDTTTNHLYVRLANKIVNALPPGEILPGIRDVLRYAGKAWVFERGLASKQEISDYWEDGVPIWKLPDSVVEHDIRGLVLAVDTRIDELIFEGADFARAGGQYSSKGVAAPVSKPRRPAYAEPPDVEGRMGGFVRAPLPAVEEPDYATPGAVAPLLGMQREAMPEMLRVNGSLKGRNLGCLQAINNDIAGSASSFTRSLSAILRFPGLCRYNSLSHTAHAHLWGLATVHQKEQYEELRAAYNRVRFAGSSPAPPFEEWRGMSDLCDHAYCR